MTLIRPIEETDLPQVLEMIHALAAHHGDAATLTADALRRDAFGPHAWVRILVAPEKGYAALCPLTQLQYGVRGMDLHHLYVTPQARGQGVGRALIRAAVALSKELRCRYLMVGTDPDNVQAQAVYRAVGFEDRPSGGPRFIQRW